MRGEGVVKEKAVFFYFFSFEIIKLEVILKKTILLRNRLDSPRD